MWRPATARKGCLWLHKIKLHSVYVHVAGVRRLPWFCGLDALAGKSANVPTTPLHRVFRVVVASIGDGLGFARMRKFRTSADAPPADPPPPLDPAPLR